MRRQLDEETARRLRQVLREGDPAAEVEPGEAWAHAARRAALRASLRAEQVPPRLPAWRRLASAAGLILAFAGVAWLVGRDAAQPPARPAGVAGSVAVPTAPAAVEVTAVAGPGRDRERRQVVFETPGGTRMIFILDPNLVL